MKRVIVTDLTRFGTPEKLCTAVVDPQTGQCFRPMPYLSSEQCAEFNMHPGAILEGDINIITGSSNPHIEDSHYNNLNYLGPASSNDFKSVLDMTLSNSISSGFGVQFSLNQKHIPVGTAALCSIITIKVDTNSIDIHEDKFKPGKIKASFVDSTGQEFRYLSITDRGFYDFAINHQQDGKIHEINDFLQSQEEVYLRVGVGRKWKVGERDGYWLQVNGIYTFPNFLEEIRSYV
jgi:hypothetical protein